MGCRRRSGGFCVWNNKCVFYRNNNKCILGSIRIISKYIVYALCMWKKCIWSQINSSYIRACLYCRKYARRTKLKQCDN